MGLTAPKVTVKDKSGKVLKNRKDYSYRILRMDSGTEVNPKTDVISYGTHLKVVVTPLGNYAGTEEKSAEFGVYAAGISAAKLTVGNNVYVPGKTDISYSLSYKGYPLTKGIDYEVVSTTGVNKAGIAKVTVKGIGYFGGTRVLSIKVGKRSAFSSKTK